MDKILFSLPVHERPDIVRGQIENINFFCPGSVICIHISAGAAALTDEFRRACDFPNVLFNPIAHETVWSGGLMHVHVSNFLHALGTGSDFTKVMMISSNELFVKHGLAEYVSRFQIGAQMEVFDGATDWGVFRPDFLQSASMQKFIASLGLPLFFGGQAEGQFASREVFGLLARLFTESFPMAPVGFPVEEVILPTVAARHAMLNVNVALPVTLANYCNNLEITPDVVEKVRAGKGTVFAKRVPRALRSPHIGASVLEGVFSVKRVPREDCELRRYITGLMI